MKNKNERLENELIDDMKIINLDEKMIQEINEMKLRIIKNYINLSILGHNSIDDNEIIDSEELNYDFMIDELNNLYLNDQILNDQTFISNE